MREQFKLDDVVKLSNHPYSGINDEGVIIDVVDDELYGVLVTYIDKEDQKNPEGHELLFRKDELILKEEL